jgi:succinate dehydrogenase/fumarate reductase cytochrome b subunit
MAFASAAAQLALCHGGAIQKKELMSMIAHAGTGRDTGGIARLPTLAPPLAALLYPFALRGFNASVTRITEGLSPLAWLGAAVCLTLAFATPLIAVLAAMSLSEYGRPTASQLRAKRAALLAVAAPTLFTFLGVVLSMLQEPALDTSLWVAGWAFVVALLLRPTDEAPANLTPRPIPAPLRVAHGVSALALVSIFLTLHITNHLFFPAGKETFEAVMKVFRHIYRTDILQPLVVALFLFQVVTGVFFVWRLTAAPSDRFRTFQIASGVYLAFYVLGHMNSVFVFARTYLGVDTGWGFATGAPAGIIKDPWNIRLVPHYWLGAFFVLAHLGTGARSVMMAHGVSKTFADRFMIGGAIVAGVIATVIMLGMCGMRLQFV